MYTALQATSKTLSFYLGQRLEADSLLGQWFNPINPNATMVVSLKSPKEMLDAPLQGLSVWLYRLIRDEERLNAPSERISKYQLQGPPLPLRLHYLATPVVNDPETAQEILGKVLQVFYDHPIFQGVDLQGDLSGTSFELHVRLEPLSLEEMTRIYDALEGPYRLSVSYEVSLVYIYSALEPEATSPVQVVMPEYGLIVP